MRILAAPDKFKGTLTAWQAAEAIARGWRRVRRLDELELLPICDGGDGFGKLLGEHLGAVEQTVATVDAAGRPLEARWWWVASRRLAIIESAAVIGLALLPPGRYHPFELDTRGLAAVLKAAARRRPQRCVVGIGGSATNDGGFGLARGLGWRFMDATGRRLGCWTELCRLARVQRPARLPRLGEMVVAVDVQNRLLGPRGATRVYGPQKGLRPEDLGPAEACLRRLVRVGEPLGWPEVAKRPGSGAAGGLGFGLQVFAGARLAPGFALFAREVGLAERVQQADVVLTGEGALDLTSVAMGKGVGELARWCRQAGVPCIGLAGQLEEHPRVRRAFTMTAALAPDLTTPEEARRHAARWLARLAEQAARDFVFA